MENVKNIDEVINNCVAKNHAIFFISSDIKNINAQMNRIHDMNLKFKFYDFLTGCSSFINLFDFFGDENDVLKFCDLLEKEQLACKVESYLLLTIFFYLKEFRPRKERNFNSVVKLLEACKTNDSSFESPFDKIMKEVANYCKEKQLSPSLTLKYWNLFRNNTAMNVTQAASRLLRYCFNASIERINERDLCDIITEPSDNVNVFFIYKIYCNDFRNVIDKFILEYFLKCKETKKECVINNSKINGVTIFVDESSNRLKSDYSSPIYSNFEVIFFDFNDYANPENCDFVHTFNKPLRQNYEIIEKCDDVFVHDKVLTDFIDKVRIRNEKKRERKVSNNNLK